VTGELTLKQYLINNNVHSYYQPPQRHVKTLFFVVYLKRSGFFFSLPNYGDKSFFVINICRKDW